MAYVDGYLIPVRRDRREAYEAFSAKVAAIYREHGALRVVDCWMDEEPQSSEAFHAEGARAALDEASEAARSFRTAAGAEPDEAVVLSWTEWPDRTARDAGLARALADPRLQPGENDEVIFEGRRLVSGGFAVILDT